LPILTVGGFLFANTGRSPSLQNFFRLLAFANKRPRGGNDEEKEALGHKLKRQIGRYVKMVTRQIADRQNVDFRSVTIRVTRLGDFSPIG
jgi:hypothetical protein